MRNILSKIKTPFAKDIFTSFSGTTISQLIPIFLAPVLTRIYTPIDFGLLGIYMSVAAIFNSFATLQYSQAILLSKNKVEEDNLTALSLGICYLFTFFVLLFILFFKKNLAGCLIAP